MVKRTEFRYNLQVAIGAAVVKRNKLVIPECAYPTHNGYFLPGFFRRQQCFHFHSIVEHDFILRWAKIEIPVGVDVMVDG